MIFHSTISSYCLQLVIHVHTKVAAFLLFHAQTMIIQVPKASSQLPPAGRVELPLTSTSHTANNEWSDHVKQ